MLDSLVRVSRRVAASADLLCREWPTATARLLAIQVGHIARRARRQDTGSFDRPLQTVETSSQAFGAGANGSYSNNV